MRAGWSAGRPRSAARCGCGSAARSAGWRRPSAGGRPRRVTSWSGAEAIGLLGLAHRLAFCVLTGDDLEERVDLRLHGDRDRALVADDPAVIVDAAHRVLRVAGLDVEQVVAERLGERVGVGDEQQRAVRAARRQRRGGGGVERVGASSANTRPWPGSTTPQPNAPSLKRAKAIALLDRVGALDPRDRAELAQRACRPSGRSRWAARARRSSAGGGPAARPRVGAGTGRVVTNSTGSPLLAAQAAAGIAKRASSAETTMTRSDDACPRAAAWKRVDRRGRSANGSAPRDRRWSSGRRAGRRRRRG